MAKPFATELKIKSPLLNYLLRRTIGSVALIFGILALTFILTNLVPSDPVAASIGPRAAENPEIVQAFKAKHGLDQPLYVQFGLYILNLFQGDLGESIVTHEPIISDLQKAVPATFELALITIILSTIFGIALALLAAYHKGKIWDQIIRVIALGGISIPTFWLALIALYVFFLMLGIAPGTGRLTPGVSPPPLITGMYTIDALVAGQRSTFTDAASRLILPVLVLTLYTSGMIARFARTSLVEVLEADYVRTARAKGLSAMTIMFSYVLRGALIPIITVMGVVFGGLLAGTVLVEVVFAWPGLGTYAYRAALSLDLRGIMAVGIVIGLVYLVVNWIIDLLYVVIDRRVSL